MRRNLGGGHGTAEGGAVDRISALPDHLLHDILIHLSCTYAAARTSVLSRRWRRVWTCLPQLAFRPMIHSAKAQIGVDAALADYAASAVISRLEIKMICLTHRVTGERVSSWLRFASRHLAGELVLCLPGLNRSVDERRDVVVLPCERATTIRFNYLSSFTLRFAQPPGAGAFTVLAILQIRGACVDGRELEAILSSRCPQLKELLLSGITLRDAAGGLSIRSGSLQQLDVSYGSSEMQGRLQIAAPEVHKLTLSMSCDIHVVAPKLSELNWRNSSYEPNCQRFEGNGSHLRRLGVCFSNSKVVPVLQQFDTVDELNLTILTPESGYGSEEKFLGDLKDVARCEVLVVRFIGEERVFRRTMLYLLTKFSGIRKLVVDLINVNKKEYSNEMYTPYSCPKSHEVLSLDSLEAIEIRSFEGSCEVLEFVEQLVSRCNIESLEKVVINYNPFNDSSLTSGVHEKVRMICRPNLKVEVNLYSGGRQVHKIFRASDNGMS